MYSSIQPGLPIIINVKRLLAVSILAICSGVAPSPAATNHAAITGHVVVTKSLTKKRVTLPLYQLRGAAPELPEPEKRSKGSSTANELSRVVIYLEGSGLKPGTPVTQTLRQKNRSFEPDLVVVPVGSTVSFPNADPIFHNVFSLSKAKHFDLGYYPAGQTRLVHFDQPGVVQVYCHIHADMSAAILVLPTAVWTRPRPDGSFSLAGVPPGDYTLVVWHRSAGFFRRGVTVSGGETANVDFVIPLHEDSGTALAAGSER